MNYSTENDNHDYQEEYQDPELYLASTGTRFANYIIDKICFYFFLSLVATTMSHNTDNLSAFGALFVLFYIFVYWVLMEYYYGKTPAKFITRTKVVTRDGTHPSFFAVLGRAICRCIPFEPFSFLGSRPVGWHDSITETRVVRDEFEISYDDDLI